MSKQIKLTLNTEQTSFLRALRIIEIDDDTMAELKDKMKTDRIDIVHLKDAMKDFCTDFLDNMMTAYEEHERAG
jgi:hypothetical protein